MWTKEQELFVKINLGYIPIREMSKRIGKTQHAIRKKIERMGWKSNFRREYAVYQSDEHLFTGTLKECVSRLKVSPSTFKFFSTPSYLKRTNDGIRIVDLGLWPINEEEYHETLKQINQRV